MTMKRLLAITPLLAVVLMALGGQSPSPTLASRIDALINEYAVGRQFMGSVLVAEKGEVILAKGYGLANVERNWPNMPETRFRIGSITKQFTAMLVTQLVEKKKLKLDDTISDFLPEFPKDLGDKITLEMLLCHSSGLILPEGIEKYYAATGKEEFLRGYLKQLSEEGLRFEPGKGYAYSNAGYFILGMIIEKVTGQRYEDVLGEQILKPLGMTQTGCDRKGLVLDNEATSYAKLRDRYIIWNDETNSYDPAAIAFGCGNMYSTVGDLFKFSTALSTNRLLSNESMDTYLKMRIVRTRPTIPYISQELTREFFGTFGNGFVGEISIIDAPETTDKHTLYWHDGTYKLFRSNHFHYSGKDQIIIICSNCSFLSEGNEMVLKIYQLLNNKPYDQVLIKDSLAQYLEEDVASHAGIPAAIDEYFRFKDDTAHFIVPERNYFVAIGRQVAERGDLDGAIAIFRAGLTGFPGFWEAYDALGDTYVMKGDQELAIQSFAKSLELNPRNPHAAEMLKKLRK
jgi:CubicO group peptidase (beta-lactamase class C family)